MPDERRRVSMGRTTYYANTYNARGEREEKSLTNGMTVQRFVYDEAGRLIQTGNVPQIGLTRTLVPEQRLLWLDDQLVGVKIKATSGAYAGKLLYAHTDHLGTPRALSRASNNSTVWRWPLETSAFGQHPAQPDPDGDGQVLTFNLRYPGQYFDAESGLHYNYFRDYEAGVGRYIESDPIGLDGGVSTYSYVDSSPLVMIDPTGESALRLPALFCKRYPRICNEIRECIAKPNTCRGKYCRAGNAAYKALCNNSGCSSSDGCVSLFFKTELAGACLLNRMMARAICYRGRGDRAHDDEIDKAQAKFNNCLGMLNSRCVNCFEGEDG